MASDEGPLLKKSNAPKVKPQGWKSLFIIFIVFICQKLRKL